MSSASQTPIALAQLARYTGGDRQLDREVLDLFVHQTALAQDRLNALLGSRDAKAWRETAHSLKGSALSVGANDLAAIAARLESLDPSASPGEAADSLGALATEAKCVAAFVEARPKV